MIVNLNDTTVAALVRVLPKAIGSLNRDIRNLAQEIDVGSKAVGRVPARKDLLVKHHKMLEEGQDALITLLADLAPNLELDPTKL
jgi:hypothetical protein